MTSSLAHAASLLAMLAQAVSSQVNDASPQVTSDRCSYQATYIRSESHVTRRELDRMVSLSQEACRGRWCRIVLSSDTGQSRLQHETAYDLPIRTELLVLESESRRGPAVAEWFQIPGILEVKRTRIGGGVQADIQVVDSQFRPSKLLVTGLSIHTSDSGQATLSVFINLRDAIVRDKIVEISRRLAGLCPESFDRLVVNFRNDDAFVGFANFPSRMPVLSGRVPDVKSYQRSPSATCEGQTEKMECRVQAGRP